MNRREMLVALTAVSTVSIVACGGPNSNQPKIGKPKPAPNYSFFTPSELAQLSTISQVIIPLTDTAGAIEANVPARIDTALTMWHDDEVRQNWREGLARLAVNLSGNNGWVDFNSLDVREKLRALKPYDSGTKEIDKKDATFFDELKRFVVLAYYTSEPGATEELIYDAVPGEYRGCVPFDEIGRTWATL